MISNRLDRIGHWIWGFNGAMTFFILVVVGAVGTAIVLIAINDPKPSVEITCDHGQHIQKHQLDTNTIEVVCVNNPKGKS